MGWQNPDLVHHVRRQHLITEARARGYGRLSLETGTEVYFAPARMLYERHGFTSCAPFADYTDDSHSTYLTLDLTPATP